jgi:hypothetical protein
MRAKAVSQPIIDFVIGTFGKLLDETADNCLSHLIGLEMVREEDRSDMRLRLFHDPFDRLKTRWMQEKAFMRLGLVKPIKDRIGRHYEYKKVASVPRLMLVDVHQVIVPGVEAMKQVLSFKPVLDDVFGRWHAPPMFPGFVSDILESRAYLEHPVVQASDVPVLVIFISIDGIQVLGALQSKNTAYKVDNFYWQLGNLHPKKRSQLATTQLFSVVLTRYVKRFGWETVLEYFVNMFLRFEQEGFKVEYEGREHVLPAILGAAMVDTLACHQLGCFNACFSKSVSPCHHCNVKRNDMIDVSCDADLVARNLLRTDQEHMRTCDQLDVLSDKEAETLRKDSGVNARSPLMELPNFSVITGLLFDFMHIILEGTLQLEVSAWLRALINARLLRLQDLNAAIKAFPWPENGDLRRLMITPAMLGIGDRITERWPRPAPKKRAPKAGAKKKPEKKNLGMTAHDMWSFANCLHRLLSIAAPNANLDGQHSRCFANHMAILTLVSSPVLCEATCIQLEDVVKRHHDLFVLLYCGDDKTMYIPKLHYLKHLVRQLLLFGPGRYHWVMRAEAHHAVCKIIKLYNTINVPWSLAMFHQIWHLWHVASGCYEEDERVQFRGTRIASADVEKLMDGAAHAVNINVGACYTCSDVTTFGHTYRPGTIIASYQPDQAQDGRVCLSLALRIEHLLCDSKNVVIGASRLAFGAFHLSSHSYELSAPDPVAPLTFANLSEFAVPWPLISFNQDGVTHVSIVSAPALPNV